MSQDPPKSGRGGSWRPVTIGCIEPSEGGGGSPAPGPSPGSPLPGQPVSAQPPQSAWAQWDARGKREPARIGYRSAHGRSRWAIGLLAVAGIVDAINLVLDLSFFPLLDRAEAGQVSDAEANAFDSIFAIGGLAQAAVILATAVAFLAWLSRIVENIPPLGGGQPLASPRAAIGWWFVPFANLVQPFRIVTDAYRRLAAARPAPGLWVVTLWWLLWIAGNLISNIALRVVLQENPSIADLRREFLAYAVSDVLTAVAAVLAVVMVRRMQRWADDRAATASGVPVPNTLALPPAAGA